jgi:rhodanese-related sulfurtransferase
MAKVKHVDPADAFAMTKKGALLVDVREEREIEHKAFDVPEVMAVPLSRFENSFREIPEKRKVILVCRSGNRSTTATSMLMSRGYRNVVNLQYGMIGWERAGLPVRRKQQESIITRLLQMFRRSA